MHKKNKFKTLKKSILIIAPISIQSLSALGSSASCAFSCSCRMEYKTLIKERIKTLSKELYYY